MLSTLVTLFVLGIVGIVVFSVVMAVIGLAFGLATFLLFKVAPLLLIGWAVLKLVQRSRSRQRLSGSADQRWLDS